MENSTLRAAIVEAQEKKQIGLFIWANQIIFTHLHQEISEELYDSLLKDLNNNIATTLLMDWKGYEIPTLLAIPLIRFHDENYLNEILYLNYNGPICLVPSNKLF